MAEVGSDRTRVVAVVGELVATGMPQHMGVRLNAQVRPRLPPARPCGRTLAPIAVRR